MANILVVDNDEAIRNIVADILEKAGHRVVKSASDNDAMELVRKNIYDIVVADLNTHQPDGISMLRAVKNEISDVDVIMMTCYSTIESAVEAMKLGAWDYIVKPISLQRLVLVINRALEKRQLRISVKHLRAQAIGKYRFENIVAGSEKMLHALELARKASTTDRPILITGESGTGKQLIGKTIHTTSARRLEPFISIDLSSVDREIMGSELFGSVSRGSPLQRGVRGAIERADRGTLFLNEITVAPPSVQERLLELLEYGIVSRIGSGQIIYVGARPVITNSVHIEQSVKRGEFRKDLFNLISETLIHLPPLRERKDDIPLLVDHFVSKYSEQSGKQIHSISWEFLSLLMSYNWPGNVRELENTIERAVAFTSNEVMSPSSLP